MTNSGSLDFLPARSSVSTSWLSATIQGSYNHSNICRTCNTNQSWVKISWEIYVFLGKHYFIKPQLSHRRIHNFGKTLRCFLQYFPRFDFCLQPRRWVLKLLPRTHFLFPPSLSLGQWILKGEWLYCERFLRELPPQKASFCALDIQLWYLSMAAAGAGRDLLHHEVPPWSIMHPAGLLQGIQALTFLFS